jgi:predicted signal transduction protein with EAL and GGDEF domain
MENNHVPGASNSEFEVRVRQAIRSAKNNLPQVAVLIFSFDSSMNGSIVANKDLPAFHHTILMRLKSGLRESDSVAPLDNGHVAVLLQSVQGPQDLDLVVNRLLIKLDEPVQINDTPIALEPRVGSALFPENGDSAESLIEYAEVELAATLGSRKSQEAVYASRSRRLFSARQWLSELRHAIVTDQLFLTFQPKVHLSKGPITGLEALLRAGPVYSDRRAHRVDHSVDSLGSSTGVAAMPAVEQHGIERRRCS